MKSVFVLILTIAFSTGIIAQSDRDKGVELFRLGDYSKAIDVLETIRSTGKADYYTATYLGAAYVKTGREDLAREVFVKATTYGPAGKPFDGETKAVLKKKPMAKFDSSVKISEGSGHVKVAVEFKQDSTVGFIFPFYTTSEKLIKGAVEAASKIRFEPAVKDGKPVTVVLVIEYSFQIG